MSIIPLRQRLYALFDPFQAFRPSPIACGSALGGSSWLSGRGRIMNFNPLFLDGNQSLFLEPLVGHAAVFCQREGGA